MFMRVVLPEPEAPISATISPRSMASVIPFSTGTSTSPRWYVLRMSSSRMSSMALPPSVRLAPAAAAEHLRREGVGGAARGALPQVADDDLVALREVALRDLRGGAVAQ